MPSKVTRIAQLGLGYLENKSLIRQRIRHYF